MYTRNKIKFKLYLFKILINPLTQSMLYFLKNVMYNLNKFIYYYFLTLNQIFSFLL